MEKTNCAICDIEVGYRGQIRLADGWFICRDCRNKVSPYFEPSVCSIERYMENIRQNEVGRNLYDAYFKMNRKVVRLCNNNVLYDPGTALICIYGDRDGIFNRRKYYNVFRLADLDKYELVSRYAKNEDGSNSQITCLHISFHSIKEGLSNYMIASDKGSINKLIMAFENVLNKNHREELINRADAAIREASVAIISHL